MQINDHLAIMHHIHHPTFLTKINLHKKSTSLAIAGAGALTLSSLKISISTN
jgi:hypothetical protein